MPAFVYFHVLAEPAPFPHGDAPVRGARIRGEVTTVPRVTATSCCQEDFAAAIRIVQWSICQQMTDCEAFWP